MKTRSVAVSDGGQGQKEPSDKRKVLMILVRLILDAAIIVLSLFFLLCLIYFINGSMEAAPTEEQHEKVRIAMAALMLSSGIPCIACIVVRFRCRKNGRHYAENSTNIVE